MKKIDLFSPNSIPSTPEPSKLNSFSHLSGFPAPLQYQKDIAKQTHVLSGVQSPSSSLPKTSKLRNLRSLQSRASVVSIALTDNMTNNEFSEMESPLRRFNKNSSRPMNVNYLSIMNVPDEYNFKSSGNETKKFNFRGQNYRNQQNSLIDKCEECQYYGEMENLYKLGWVAWSWIVFLFLLSVILFFIPIVMKSFQQKELICPECGSRVRTQTPTCL